MSSASVRQAFRDELAAAFPALPLYATLGVRVDNAQLPDLWAASDFIPIGDIAVSLGSPACRRESGTFRCFVVGRTGDGDAAIVAQADAIAAHFRGWRKSAPQLRVTSVVPPAPSEFSDGRWLVSAVDFAFMHDYYQ